MYIQVLRSAAWANIFEVTGYFLRFLTVGDVFAGSDCFPAGHRFSAADKALAKGMWVAWVDRLVLEQALATYKLIAGTCNPFPVHKPLQVRSYFLSWSVVCPLTSFLAVPNLRGRGW